VTISPENESQWQNLLNKINGQFVDSVPAMKIGKVNSTKKFLITQAGDSVVQISMDQLKDSYENAISRRMQV
jgi:hypothetical protein